MPLSWDDTPEFEKLEEILYENVRSDDYTEDEFHQALDSLGHPEDWEFAVVQWDEQGEAVLAIYDENGVEHVFSIGGQGEFNEIYEWLEDHDVEFDVEGS